MAASAALDPKGREIWPDVVIPPGEHLVKILEAKGWSRAELARRMGRPVQVINEIARGVKAITPENALALERVLGISGSFWVRLEADYQYNKARLAAKARRRARSSRG